MNTEALISALLANPIDEFKLDASLSDDDIETLVQRLKDEADRHWYIDPNDSLQYAEKIVAIGHYYENPSHIALGMMSKGDALRYLARYDDAWDLLVKAGDLFLEIDDEVGWARTCIGRLAICIQVDKIEQAKSDASQALQIFLNHQDYDKYARVLNNLTYVCNHQGSYPQTIHIYEELSHDVEIFNHILPEQLVVLYNNIGTAHYELGELNIARTYYEKEIEIDIQQNNVLGMAIDSANIAYVEMSQGRYRHALSSFHQATRILADKLPDQYIGFLIGIAECYDHLNRHEDVYTVCRSTIEMAQTLNCKQELARLLTLLATTHSYFGNYGEAFDALKEATQIYDEIKAPRWKAYTTLLTAEILYLKGEDAFAQEYLTRYFEQIPDGTDIFSCEARLLQARLFLCYLAYKDANDLAWMVLIQAKQNHLLIIQYDAHVLLGVISETTGQSRRAFLHNLAATLIAEKMQDQLTLSMRSNLISDKIQPFNFIIGHYLEQADINPAFFHLQRIKTQVWMGILNRLDDLTIQVADTDGEDITEIINELRYKHHWLYQKLNSPEHFEDSYAGTETQAYYLDQLQLVEKEMKTLLEIANLRSHHGITKQALSPNVMRDIQMSLDIGEAVVEFYSDGNRFWIFVITPSQCFSQLLNTTASKVEKLVHQYRFNIDCMLAADKQSVVAKQLQKRSWLIRDKLSRELLGELDHLLSTTHRLYIVPYSILHLVPFQTLSYSGTYLIESHEIIMLPFSGFLLKDPSDYPEVSFVLENDWDGLLQNTRREAEFVAKLIETSVYTGETCVRPTISGKSGAILHIAAHSEFRLDNPDLSYIYLSDGHLFTTDLLHNRIRFELVVLSACESGRARVTSGEDLVGVGHAFLYSGTDSVVASLWRVEEEATYELMCLFYTNLINGQSKAAALRNAQLNYLSQHPDEHFAFWGAFQLMGNPKSLQKLNK